MEKVIIIGAGPAGLTAAIELLKNGGDYDVTILEGSQAMGGISQTVRYNGNRMDIGGHRFFSKNQQVMDWWADLMPLQGKPAYDDKKLGHEKPLAENGPDPETEDNVMLVRDRVSRIYYNKHFFDYPISMKPETIKNMGFVTTMKAGFSYLWACVFKKPETNLENFYINRFGKVLYSMFFEGYTEKLWGRHPSEISADWGSQRVKGLSITALLKDMFKKVFGTKNKGEVETSLIEQFWYPKYGPGQLWETAAEKVKELGGKILTGCQVKKIMCEGRKQVFLSLLRSLFHNPLLIYSALGAAVSLLHIAVPKPILSMSAMLGSTSAPCALFCMGMILSKQMTSSQGFVKGWARRQFPLHVLKLVVEPLFIFGVLYLLGVRGIALASATIVAAMPTAVAAYIIAEKYQVATEDSSLGIVVDTALSAVSIPLLIVAFQYYGLL